MIRKFQTVRQHKSVAQVCIVIDANGKIILKARKELSPYCAIRWAENRTDFEKEFATYEDAFTAASKCCPIFHGSHGPVLQIDRIRYQYGTGYVGF